MCAVVVLVQSVQEQRNAVVPSSLTSMLEVVTQTFLHTGQDM
jgi:hypothetical protein